MKYRLYAFIVIFALLLSAAACSLAPQQEETTAPVQETTQQAPVQQNGGVSFRLTSLPTALAAPVAADNAVRLYDGYITEFYPSTSYNGVLIYEGSVTVCSNEEGQSVEVVRYGLCTAAGALITDAVFSAAYPVTLADGTVYYALERLERVKTETEVNTEITVFFVSTDGAWSSGVYTAVGDGVSITALNNNGLCMLVDTQGIYNKCYILNKNCDVLKFIASSQTVEYSFGMFSEGLCPVSKTENGKTEAYYMDVNGERLFGDYSAAFGFSGGRAVVRNKDGKYHVIDTTGFTYIGPVEYPITQVGGYFLCKDKTSGGTSVYDSTGVPRRVVETSGEVSVLGKTVPVILENSTGTYYSIFTGTALRCHNTGEAAQEYLGFGDYYVYYSTSEDNTRTAYIFDANGDFVYSVYNFGAVVSSGFDNDIIAVSDATGGGTIRFINLAARTLAAEITASAAAPADGDGLYVTCTQLDDSGKEVLGIYRLTDMSLLAQGFESASVIKAGETVYINSRSNGRLNLSLADKTLVLSLPDGMTD